MELDTSKIKIVKSGLWAQFDPSKPILDIKEGDDADRYPKKELLLMIEVGWAVNTIEVEHKKQIDENESWQPWQGRALWENAFDLGLQQIDKAEFKKFIKNKDGIITRGFVEELVDNNNYLTETIQKFYLEKEKK